MGLICAHEVNQPATSNRQTGLRIRKDIWTFGLSGHLLIDEMMCRVILPKGTDQQASNQGTCGGHYYYLGICYIWRPPHPEGHLDIWASCPCWQNDPTVKVQSLPCRVILPKGGKGKGTCVQNVLPDAEA